MPNKDKECDQLSLFFRAFSNRLKLKIICTLRGGEKTVTEITEAVGASKYNVSQQLKHLSLVKILTSRKKGRHVYYSILHTDMIVFLEEIMGKIGDKKYADWLKAIDDHGDD